MLRKSIEGMKDKMISGEVKSIALIEHIKEGLDFCEIVIDFDTLNIFYNYNELIKFVDELVIYDIRWDVYKDKPVSLVANIAKAYTIQTIDKTDNIQLLPELAEERPGCNFEINSLRFGHTEYGCTAYFSSYECGSSDKTKWIDLTMVDMKSKVFTLRLFTKNIEGEADPLETADALKGHYVKFDITSTRYGYQTKGIELVNVEVLPPPEVETAIQVIRQASDNDDGLRKYMGQYDFIDTLRNVTDIEPGYHLVRIATELEIIRALKSVTNIYDTKLLTRAAITSRGYLLPAKTKFSRPVLNTTKLLRTELATDRELLLMLDPFAEEQPSHTKCMYIKLAGFSEYIINERRGTVEEKFCNDVDSARNFFNGLL